jgi:hypothetical protein
MTFEECLNKMWDGMVWTGVMWLRVEPQWKAVVGVMRNKNDLKNSGNFMTS